MKKIFATLVVIIGFFLLTTLSGNTHAQTLTASVTPDPAKTYNITFPVSQLGNCADLVSCKAYCDDPSHQDACTAYAKSKGFYKDQTSDPSVLQSAETELGCNSAGACKTFCEDSANYQKCRAFAQEHNLTKETATNPGDTNTLERAKTVLGCDSVASCRDFCSQSVNQQKCSDFAKQNGLKGGLSKVGPGGCTSAATCNSYCADPSHFNQCQQFPKKDASGSGTFTGPGGCTSESSCRDFCTKNPTVCQNFGKNRAEGIGQSEMISQYPSGYPRPPFLGTSRQYPTFYPSRMPQVSTYPGFYPPTHPTSSDTKAQYCSNYPGCTWTGTNCQCPPRPTQSTNPAGNNTSLPPPPAVKGASTHKTYLQLFLDFIFGR